MKKMMTFLMFKSITNLTGQKKLEIVFINVISSQLHENTKPCKSMYTFENKGMKCHSDSLNLRL